MLDLLDISKSKTDLLQDLAILFQEGCCDSICQSRAAKRGGFKRGGFPDLDLSLLFCPFVIDLLMGLFRGAVFRHGGGALKQPVKQPTETPTSTLALMGRFLSLMGRFPDLNGAFRRFRPKGPFYLLKIHWKTAH